MDSAYLHNSVFNIELKRRELEQQNLTRSEVKRWFEEKASGRFHRFLR